LIQGTRHRRDATPYTIVFSIPLFAVVALLGVNFYLLIFQAAYIFLASILLRMDLKRLGWRMPLSLMPILLFVILFNAFRGPGSVLFRAGPILIMGQGLLRGLYFMGVVVELWFMSRLLTSFTEEDLLCTLNSLGRLCRIRREAQDAAGFALMLYYVLKIFHSTYAELRQFLRGGSSLSQRTLLFINEAFLKAEEIYDRTDHTALSTRKPSLRDALYATGQLIVLLSAILLQSRHVLS
jgi:energy-coupling factor transporter transmembrane protein EcfT